jgi:hypothetical protein
MRKYLAAGLIGLALVAGQAAASEATALGVGDRVGSDSAASNQLDGHIPLYYWFFGAAFIGVVAWAVSDHGGHPISP